MARRRSMNRRASRRSMNITELDQNSELIDTRDPMWWKNIEADTTVRRSRRSAFSNTTDPILNDDSYVDSSQLHDEWWQKLDKTDTDLAQRISVGEIEKPVETPLESFASDETDEISIKKRKIRLRAARRKSVDTENFLSVLDDSTLKKGDGSINSRNDTDETNVLSKKRNRRGGLRTSGEKITDTSLNSTADTDVIVKRKPKAFGKRSTKIPDDIFDKVLENNSGEDPRSLESSMKKTSRKNASVVSEANESLSRGKTLSESNNREETTLMGPPENVSRPKRLSSASRRLESTSGSESDGGRKKKKLRFVKKKERKTVSVNPFEDLIEENINLFNVVGRENSREENLSIEKNKEKNLTTDNSRILNRKKTNTSRTSLLSENSDNGRTNSGGRKSSLKNVSTMENSFDRAIEESNDEGDKSSTDMSFTTALAPKILGISLTRRSLDKGDQSPRKEKSVREESLENDSPEAGNRQSRILRSSRRFIHDSAYELPDKERSPTPRISGSENENEKSSRRNSSTGNVSKDSSPSDVTATKKQPEVIDPTNKSFSSLSRKSETRSNNLRSRILSEDETSLENLEYSKKSQKILKNVDSYEERPEIPSHEISKLNEKSEGTRKSNLSKSSTLKETNELDKTDSTSIANKSKLESDVSYSMEDKNISEKISPLNFESRNNSLSFYSQKSRKGRKEKETNEKSQGTRKSNFSKDSTLKDTNELEKTDSTSIANKSNLESDVSYSMEDKNISEKMPPLNFESRNNSLSFNSQKSRKRIKRQSRRSVLNAESTSEDEENFKKRRSNSRRLNLKENSRQSEKNLTSRNSQKNFLPEMDSSENEEEEEEEEDGMRSVETLENSQTPEKSVTSDRIKEAVATEKLDSILRRESFVSRENFEEIMADDDRNDNNLSTGSNTMRYTVKSKSISKNPEAKNLDVSLSSIKLTQQNVSLESPSNTIPPLPDVSGRQISASTPITKTKNSEGKQRNIREFFPSKFLQKTNDSSVRVLKTSFDKDKLKALKEKMEEMKKNDPDLTILKPEVKKKDANLSKRRIDLSKEKKSQSTKKIKMVDKAYIVNGKVYKKPKLPRPKSWATDRLYRHLWKKMEPKYNLSTRIKSEKFVLQLAEVVALVTRRKKYDSYKFEVEELMKEMARLGIVKTPNDFYDFCYDFLPYDFRVKVTPIQLPGNICSIPFDPKKLYTPILEHT